MPAGRPPIFSSVEEIQSSIDKYFEYVKGEWHEETETSEDKKGKAQSIKHKVWDRQPEPLTITGLAIYLGFASRQSFYDYEKDGEFSYTLKRARLKIEQSYEFALHGTSPAGAIFALKNFGWTDKQEIDQKTEHSGTINHKIDHSKLSDEALREIAGLDKPEGSQD